MSRKDAIEQAAAYVDHRARESIRSMEEAVQTIDKAVEAVRAGETFKCFTFVRQATEMWCIILTAWFGEPAIFSNDTVLFWGEQQAGCHIITEIGDDDHLHIHVLAPHVTITFNRISKRCEQLFCIERRRAARREIHARDAHRVKGRLIVSDLWLVDSGTSVIL